MSPAESKPDTKSEDPKLPLSVWLGSTDLAFGYPKEVVRAATSRADLDHELTKTQVEDALEAYLSTPVTDQE